MSLDLLTPCVRQIAGAWGHPGVMIFDVVALERTTGGQAVLRDQLFPMFEDQASMKVIGTLRPLEHRSNIMGLVKVSLGCTSSGLVV